MCVPGWNPLTFARKALCGLNYIPRPRTVLLRYPQVLSQSRKNLYAVCTASKDLPRGLAWGAQRGFPLFYVLAKVYKFQLTGLVWFPDRKVFRKV